MGFSSVRDVLSRPSRRWWLTPSRKRIMLKAKVRPVRGGEVSATTFDLSESGAFISTEHAVWHDRLRQTSTALEIGAHCSLKLDLDAYRALQCIGKVVRHTEPRGRYPAGFALQFEGLTPDDRRLLLKFLARLRDTAAEPQYAGSESAAPEETAKNKIAA
jgi:hypothetical protein